MYIYIYIYIHICIPHLKASCLQAQLRVGRTIQPPDFWAILILLPLLLLLLLLLLPLDYTTILLLLLIIMIIVIIVILEMIVAIIAMIVAIVVTTVAIGDAAARRGLPERGLARALRGGDGNTRLYIIYCVGLYFTTSAISYYDIPSQTPCCCPQHPQRSARA